MKRLEAFGWSGVLMLALVLGSAASAGAQCLACIYGCTGVPPPGYLFCREGTVSGVPVCAVGGACSFGGGGGGEEFPPKLARPMAAAVGSWLRVYELLFRCDRGGRQVLDGETARLLAGAARPFTVPGVIAALRKLAPGAAGRLALVAGLVIVGPGSIQAADLGGDGSGYGLRLVSEGVGTRMSVCSVRNEAVVGPLAQATVGPGDLLVVQVSIEGSDFLCVLSPMPVAGGPGVEEDEAARLRGAFLDDVDSAWRVTRDPGLSLRFVQLGGASCP